MKIKKPTRKKIREWLISEIEEDIEELERKLFEKNEDLIIALTNKFTIKEIHDYKKTDWYIDVKAINDSYHFFVDKKTCKNKYEKEGWT